MKTKVNSGGLSPILLFLLALVFPASAVAVNYVLPRDLGLAGSPFSSCSKTTFICPSSVALGNNSGDTINFSQNMTLQINGDFSMVNNGAINSGTYAVLISATGNILLGNNNTSLVNFSAGGNFSAGSNANITGNVSAGGTISVDSGTITGFCFASKVSASCQGSNGCVASALGGDTLITCTRDGAVNIPAGVTSLRYLLVGGGGGGGGIKKDDAGGSGGGGGGAVRTGTILGAFPSATYYVSVGGGGAAGFFNETTGTGSAGGTGGTSSFYTLTANGGAGGATQDINNQNGNNGSNGGSAGGGRTTGAGGTTATPRPPNGYPGGNGAYYVHDVGTAAGGGGGAGGAGSSGYYYAYWYLFNSIADSIGGNGGNGLSSNVSGSAITYGGGGGGGTGRTGTWFTGTVSGGLGRDGGGSAPNSRGSGNPGLANRGGGGAGATGSISGGEFSGGAGGSGVVILRFPTVSGPNHIRLLHDGEGLTCAPESITVKACADAACSTAYTASAVSVTLNTIANATWSANPVSTDPATGTVVVTLRKPDSTQTPNPVTLGVAAPNTGRCFIGASENCNLTFHDSGFVFDVLHHVAETSQTVAIRAVKKSETGVTCAPAFTGVKPVTFTCAYGNPTSGTLPVRVSGTALNAANSVDDACDASGKKLDLTFNASGTASVTVQYADVGNMTLNARLSDGVLTMTGNDTFIAAPASFEVTAATPFVAGQSFTAKVTGKNASATAQTTPNFGKETTPETVELKPVTTLAVSASNSELAGPVGGATGTLTAGAFTPAKCSPAVAGAVCDTALAWSEVGDLKLAAVLKSGSYLASGLTAWGSGNAGPFKPAYLTTQLADAAGSVTSDQSCKTFTYSGQPFRLRVTAMRPSNTSAFGAGDAAAPTLNYTGTYAKLVTLGSDGSGACMPTTTGFSNNTVPAANFASGFAATPPVTNTAAPLPATYAQALAAPAAVTVCAKDTDEVNSHGQTQATLNIRNGRLRMLNAYGSELLPLGLPFQVEYYNGDAKWPVNTADHCTGNGAAGGTVSLAISPPAGATDITAFTCVLDSLPMPGNSNRGCSTAGPDPRRFTKGGVSPCGGIGQPPCFAGDFNLWLAAPGTGHAGSVIVTGTVPNWLQASGSISAQARFGTRRAPYIHLRERF